MICNGIPNDRPSEDIVRIYMTAFSIFNMFANGSIK